MSQPQADTRVLFEDVSKFYGEVLGINRVSLALPPGITSLVGPNGSGKTTLMNLMAGLLRPDRGSVRVLGIGPDRPEALFRALGYCAQYDSFPAGLTGYQFLYHFARVRGLARDEASRSARTSLERVGLADAARRRIGAYSKGMRQRIKLAQAMAHDPSVLLLDEPLNGLDPVARAEVIDLFRALAREGRHVIVSSHILHEVDLISDCVVILKNGYVVAEGNIRAVRGEMQNRPVQVLVRCDRPEQVASRLFEDGCVVEARLHEDRAGLLASTKEPDRFYLALNRIVTEGRHTIESIMPADEDVRAVYRYLVGASGEGA